HFVTVTDGGWDTHQDNFKSLKTRLLPRLDRGYAALLQDLHDRGLLKSTLVVWFGDFGRTPKINPSAGPDHWASAGVCCLGGGSGGRDQSDGGVCRRQPGGAAGSRGDDLLCTRHSAAHVVSRAGRPADRTGTRGQASAAAG